MANTILLEYQGNLQEIELPNSYEDLILAIQVENPIVLLGDKPISALSFSEIQTDSLLTIRRISDLCKSCLNKGIVKNSDYVDASYCTSCAEKYTKFRIYYYIDCWCYYFFEDDRWHDVSGSKFVKKLTGVHTKDPYLINTLVDRHSNKWEYRSCEEDLDLDLLADDMVFNRRTKVLTPVGPWHQVFHKFQITFVENPTLNVRDFCSRLSEEPERLLRFFRALVRISTRESWSLNTGKQTRAIGEVLDILTPRIEYGTPQPEPNKVPVWLDEKYPKNMTFKEVWHEDFVKGGMSELYSILAMEE